MDIDKLLADAKIEALNEFEDEPTIVPAAQRVRDFLTDLAGPGWSRARVISYQLSGGDCVHLASIPKILTRGTAVVVVGEALDGSLSLPSPFDNGGEVDAMQFLVDSPSPSAVTPEQADIYADERACLDKILPALAEVGRVLAADETVKPRRKKRLLGQLNHAVGHLLKHLEGMLPEE